MYELIKMNLGNVSVDNGRSFYRPKRCVVFNIDTIGKVQCIRLKNKQLDSWRVTIGEFYLQLVS